MTIRCRHYSREEIAHIVARYPVATTRTIAAELGRPHGGVKQKVLIMGLKRTAKQTSAVYSTWSRVPLAQREAP